MTDYALALKTAISTGDVAALACCFQESQLIDRVAETEHALATGVRQTHWFVYLHCTPSGTWKVRNIFTTAVGHGHVDVLQRLFAPERVALMPLALTHVWPLTTRSAIDTNNAEVLELMLTVAE